MRGRTDLAAVGVTGQHERGWRSDAGQDQVSVGGGVIGPDLDVGRKGVFQRLLKVRLAANRIIESDDIQRRVSDFDPA